MKFLIVIFLFVYSSVKIYRSIQYDRKVHWLHWYHYLNMKDTLLKLWFPHACATISMGEICQGKAHLQTCILMIHTLSCSVSVYTCLYPIHMPTAAYWRPCLHKHQTAQLKCQCHSMEFRNSSLTSLFCDLQTQLPIKCKCNKYRRTLAADWSINIEWIVDVSVIVVDVVISLHIIVVVIFIVNVVVMSVKHLLWTPVNSNNSVTSLQHSSKQPVNSVCIVLCPINALRTFCWNWHSPHK